MVQHRGRLPLARSRLVRGVGGPTRHLPLDTPGIPSVGLAWGVAPLRKAHADGPLFTLHNFEGDPFVLNADGLNFPVQAFADWLEVDPVTGIGGAYINTAHDHSGHGRDLTAGTDVWEKPALWLIEGRVSVWGAGCLVGKKGNNLGTYLNVPAGLSLDMRDHAVYAVQKPYSTSNAATAGVEGAQSTLFNPSGAVGGGYWWFTSADDDTDGPVMGLIDQVGFAPWLPIRAPKMNISKSVVSLWAGASDVRMGINEHIVSQGAPLPTSGSDATGGFLGRFPYDVSGIFGGRLDAFVVLDAAPTDAVDTKVRHSFYHYRTFRDYTADPNRVNILVSGASLDQGQGSGADGGYNFTQNGGGYSWVEWLADRFSTEPVIWHNIAVTGNTTTQDRDSYLARGPHCYDPGAAKNIAILGNSAVGNDAMKDPPNSGAVAYAAFAEAVAAAQGDGFEVATYLFDNSGDTPGTTGYDYNALVAANAATLGVTILHPAVDVDASGQNPTDHFNMIGQRQMADQIGPGLLAFINS